MAGLTSIREVAALFSPTRITYKLNKDNFLSNNAVLNLQLFIKIEITAGLTSVREVAALYRSRG